MKRSAGGRNIFSDAVISLIILSTNGILSSIVDYLTPYRDDREVEIRALGCPARLQMASWLVPPIVVPVMLAILVVGCALYNAYA